MEEKAEIKNKKHIKISLTIIILIIINIILVSFVGVVSYAAFKVKLRSSISETEGINAKVTIYKNVEANLEKGTGVEDYHEATRNYETKEGVYLTNAPVLIKSQEELDEYFDKYIGYTGPYNYCKAILESRKCLVLYFYDSYETDFSDRTMAS